jgi:hypothetical protein
MQMKELEDYDWFPQTLRTYQMQTIGYMVKMMGIYKPIVPLLEHCIQQQKLSQVVDLCSGSGLPSIYIKERFSIPIPFVLTDKYPQQIPRKEGITYASNSISVLEFTPQSHVLYTMYNAFHHFTDAEQLNILQKCKAHNASICIVEVITPTLQNIIQVIIASTLIQVLIVPFIKPFSWKRLLFTYIIPINILTVLIDGIITVFKTKTKKQYQRLTQNLNSTTYSIETNAIFNFPNKIIVLTAQPTHVIP